MVCVGSSRYNSARSGIRRTGRFHFGAAPFRQLIALGISPFPNSQMTIMLSPRSVEQRPVRDSWVLRDDSMNGENEIPPAEAQARLAAIVESSDDAIVSKTLQGVITTWNNGAERIFGWTAAEVIGKPITIIIPPDRLDEEPKILSGPAAAASASITSRPSARPRTGRLLDISVTISPVRDERARSSASRRWRGTSRCRSAYSRNSRPPSEGADDVRGRPPNRAREVGRGGQPGEGPLPQRAVARAPHAADAGAGGGQPDRCRPAVPPHLAEQVR